MAETAFEKEREAFWISTAFAGKVDACGNLEGILSSTAGVRKQAMYHDRPLQTQG